ncbi:hypothetical protein Vau01_108130 [Virgisporangium aurantiacum]|uniref:Uncharacterized protein n=1 Tax=Virgisporangium aurantiacum TaxID=175570 RepID=A0A8J4E913_9ACTN|nr:hypothetical protein Vau01_108130 [Virgisporangium aurantiacum]
MAPIEIGTDLPTFNIIALGGQETGKTVLLASMFHRLTTEVNEGVFRLETSLDQAVHLTNLYRRLRDPDAEWPPGTSLGETRSFTFTCIGSAGGTEFPVLRFNYLDYAGELVGGGPTSEAALEQQEERQRDLEQRIEVAHALFGIIDGQRMLAGLRGDPKGLLYLETSIIPMIGLLRRAKCPVHFVLTKWDLFDGTLDLGGAAGSDEPMDENDRLVVVRDELMSQPAIRNLVEQRRREKRIVRLVPVSAIGRQFATMDAEGHMLKRRNGRLRPVNIEIPLCAVLPDLFTQIEEQLQAADEEKLLAARRDRARLTALEAVSAVGKLLARPAGSALRIAADVAIGRNAFNDRLADMFIDWAGHRFDDKMGRVNAVVDDAKQQLNELGLIRNAVLREFSERMIVLKRQLPASDLADRSSR